VPLATTRPARTDAPVPAHAVQRLDGLHATARSARFREALAFVERVAGFDHAIVLIEGEPGTGKTLLARHLHRLSRRADEVFHRVDLGTLDDSLSGSDLFGHVGGAFTGAQGRRVGHFLAAQRGTLFLDELAKATKSVQQKLLHAIEYREITPVGAERPVPVDVRLVAATNVALEDRVDAGEFLPDLLPRFGCFRVRVPALRDRRCDILPLARHFAEAHAAHFGYREGPPAFDETLGAALERAPWPGNVRELESAVQYLLVSGGGDAVLGLEHCVGQLTHLRRGGTEQEAPLSPERVRAAVVRAGGVSAAARQLRVSRPTVYRYLDRDGSAGRANGDHAENVEASRL